MKHIFDIYSECNATPANTVGIGNPMLPTAEEPGTEPLHPHADSADAKPKKKKQKAVKEGILDNIDDQIAVGTETMDFIDWFVENRLPVLNDKKEDLTRACLSAITVKNGVVTIDASKDESKKSIGIVIKKPIPSKIHTIKVYNVNNYDIFAIRTFLNDISNVNIEVYSDGGHSYGPVMLVPDKKITGGITLGNIICGHFGLNLFNKKIDSLTLGKDSVINDFDSSETYLKQLNVNLSSAANVAFNFEYVSNTLKQAGIIPQDCKLRIK